MKVAPFSLLFLRIRVCFYSVSLSHVSQLLELEKAPPPINITMVNLFHDVHTLFRHLTYGSRQYIPPPSPPRCSTISTRLALLRVPLLQ